MKASRSGLVAVARRYLTGNLTGTLEIRPPETAVQCLTSSTWISCSNHDRYNPQDAPHSPPHASMKGAISSSCRAKGRALLSILRWLKLNLDMTRPYASAHASPTQKWDVFRYQDRHCRRGFCDSMLSDLLRKPTAQLESRISDA